MTPPRPPRHRAWAVLLVALVAVLVPRVVTTSNPGYPTAGALDQIRAVAEPPSALPARPVTHDGVTTEFDASRPGPDLDALILVALGVRSAPTEMIGRAPAASGPDAAGPALGTRPEPRGPPAV